MPSRKPIIFFATIVLIVGILTGYIVGTNTLPIGTVQGANSLNVEITPRSVKLSVAQPCEFNAHVYNGSAPYSYYWKATSFLDENTTLEENYFVGDTNPVTFMFTESCAYADLSVTVKDSSGNMGYATVVVYDPNVFTLSSGIYPGTARYTVWRNEDTFYAKDNYGSIAFSGANASYIFNSVFSAMGAKNVSTVSSGIVYVKDGIYPLSAPLQLVSGVRLSGESMYSTIFQASSNMTADPYGLLDLSWCYYVTLENFKIDGQNSVYNHMRGVTVQTYSAYYFCEISRVWFYNLQMGLYSGNGKLTVQNCYFSSIGATGGNDAFCLDLDGGSHYVINDNDICTAPAAIVGSDSVCTVAIYLSADYVTVTNNRINSTQYFITIVDGSSGITVADNVILGGLTSVGSISNTTIRNNIGYVTENWGIETTMGNATVVSHGLSSGLEGVLVSGQNYAGKVWWTNIDSSSFAIYFDTGASISWVSWYAWTGDLRVN